MIVLAVLAVLVNVFQYVPIDRPLGGNVSGIWPMGTSDGLLLMYRGCPRCVERYSMHMALGLVAPGARVIVATPTTLAADRDATEELVARLYSFGQVDRVDWADVPAPAQLLAGLDPTPYVIASGPGGKFGEPWALAVDPSYALPQAANGDPDGYLANALARSARPPDRREREFVIIRWAKAHPGSLVDYQELVVETSLLPAGARAGLTT